MNGADLTGVNFTFTDLSYADLRGCKGVKAIRGKGAILNNTKFDLSMAEYFDSGGLIVQIKKDHCVVTNANGGGKDLEEKIADKKLESKSIFG